MSIRVSYFTDPACPWSWGLEPVARRLKVDFGDHLSWTYVMGGLARDFEVAHKDHGAAMGGTGPVYSALSVSWMDAAEATRMPLDPRLWSEGPIRSTYPACIAVKAAFEQRAGEAYLRALREGLMCFRRTLDTPEALVEEARRARLDIERFRIDLASNAVLEAFGADLERSRAIASGGGTGAAPCRNRSASPAAAAVRPGLPAMAFGESAGDSEWVHGFAPYERFREAALAAGAEPLTHEPPSVTEALRRFGSMATRELEVVCALAGPPARAELWRLASEWVVRPTRVLTGELWELAD